MARVLRVIGAKAAKVFGTLTFSKLNAPYAVAVAKVEWRKLSLQSTLKLCLQFAHCFNKTGA
jgi:hypothetical protein